MSYALEGRVQLGHTLASTPMKFADSGNSPEALIEVAKQFESIFMNMMLKSMRAGNRALSEGNYLNSFESNMYEDMLDEKLSVELSENGGLGIADLLVRQFSSHTPTPTYDLQLQPSVEKVFPSERRAAFDSAANFVETILPQAQRVAKALDIDPKFIVAQAALETGWGQQVMFDGSGANSFNLFGIKKGRDWSGQTLDIASMEVKDGVAAPLKSSFKMYSGYAGAFADYEQLLNEERYEGVKGSTSAQEFAQALSQGGYATDPQYVDKLTRVFDSVNQIQLALSQ